MLPWLVPTLLLFILGPVVIFTVLPSGMTWTFLLIIVLLAFLTVVVDKITDGINATWGEGARGEFRVGEELDKLYKEGFHIFHDWNSGRGNVDHFVVGPQGVFAVETKAWEGEITCRDGKLLRDGNPVPGKDPIVQVTGEALDVRKLIEEVRDTRVWVQPILCFSKAELRCYGMIRKVEITDLGSVRRTIIERSDRLPRERVNSISYFLEKRLGVSPSAKPGIPPSEPGSFKKLLKLEYLFIAAYTAYWVALSLIFADTTAKFFESAAGLYRFVGVWLHQL